MHTAMHGVVVPVRVWGVGGVLLLEVLSAFLLLALEILLSLTHNYITIHIIFHISTIAGGLLE